MQKAKQINFDRKRKANVPLGWTMVRHTTASGNENVMWRCPYIHFNMFTQKYERCSYICRKDRIENKHYHEFKIPPEEDDLLKENYIEKTAEYTNDSFIQQLEIITAKFIGENSISASVSCSNQYCSFLCDIAQLSINYFHSCKQISQDPSKVIKPFNKNNMKHSILKAGDEAFNQMMKDLTEYKFVNMMIDSATVNTMRIVHVTLSNPFSGMAPLPFRSVKKEGSDWGILEYQQEIETSLAEIQSYNFKQFENGKINVISVCHDRLPAQSAAISKVLSNKNIEFEFGPIVDVSCLNHLIHNSFLGAINKCNELKKLIPTIEELITTLRKRESVEFIGRKMPHPPKTRWLYLCDSLSFIIRNIDQINEYLVNIWLDSHVPQENQSPVEFEEQAKQEAMIQLEIYELYFILMPLQKVSLCFECEQSRLSDVIPVIHVLMSSYKRLIDESYIKLDDSLVILHELLAQVLARFETYLPREAWACWSLSRAGRFQLRSINSESGLVTGNINDYNDESYSLNEAAQNMENEIINIMCAIESHDQNDSENIEEDQEDTDAFIENNDHVNAIDENKYQSSDNENILKPPEDNEFDKITLEAVEKECNLNLKFREKLSYWRSNTLESMIELDLTIDAYDKALDIIKYYNNLLNENSNDEEITNLFDEWLFNRQNIYPNDDMNKPNDFMVWQHFSKHDKLKHLSFIAMRLLSIGTSESDVERLISIHRFLVHDRMSNLSSDVLLARLRMRANALSQNSLMNKQ